MRLTEDRRKMLKVATLYYDHGLTQSEIAKKMGISRPIISKMLQQAKELGMVEIYIKDESSHSVKLALAIEESFNLNEVVVVAGTGTHLKKNVARAAASYLVGQLKPQQKIGLSWGTTMAEFIEEVPYVHHPDTMILPLAGGVASQDVKYDANHLSFLLSEKLSGECAYIYAPALAETKDLKEVLVASKMVSDVLNQGRQVDLAFIGVGQPASLTTWENLGYIEADEFTHLQKQGMVGDAVASFFNQKGEALDNDFTRRMIGVTLDELKQIPNVVLLAAGQQKAESVHAILKSAAIRTLIIDQTIAEKLLTL
ncbi:sugar-binding transcriptional regulator [Isobaculum melis]|uniref:DNA-binding transcriptional regulator LsrR, DeoR family n=1 Tax=Isobaculum melis TaxID=142588 RepID=A0A1H9U339_9LACT|nr:sugar-binding transcriptional regulator [Isobaculum melis]SES03587.1 DNA-binding transcriptional regulator LsrR, DeoR family [Isobaculum melis]